MGIKKIVSKCPNCGGKMEIDTDNGYSKCPYCGQIVAFDENDNITRERIRTSGNVRIAHDNNETTKTIHKMQGKVEIEKSKYKSTRLLIWLVIIVVLICAFAGYKAIHRYDNYMEEQSHKDDITLTQTIVNYQGTRLSDMERCLKDAGFTNIEDVPLNDLTEKLSNKEGLITDISINGTKDFKAGDWIAKDAPIRITYHSVNKDLEGIQAFENADYYVGKDYSIAESEMSEAGFSNIELVPVKDSKEGDEQIGDIIEVLINGNSSFKFTTLFAEDAKVVIKYHAQKLKTIEVGTSSEDFKGKNYRTVINDLKSAGFYNFDYTLIEDASLFVKKNTVEEVSINGSTTFYSFSTFEEDARISISIHIDKEDKNKIEVELYPDSGRVIMPLSEKEMVGKDYKQVVQQLEDAGFTNVNPYPNPDIKEGLNPLKKKDGEIQTVTINGSTDFKKNTSYQNDVFIRIIYHTYAEEEEKVIEVGENEVLITFSAKDLKSKNYEDVVKQFKDLGFTNVGTEELKDIKKDSKLKFLSAEDGEVDKVSINNNEKFKEGDIFAKDAKVVVTYHTYADEEEEAPVELGENEVQITFSAKDLKSENYEDVVKQFKDLGFTNVTTKELKDIKKDSKLKFLSAEDGEVDKVSIDDNEKFKEGDIFSKDAKVVVTYHTYADEEEEEPVELGENEVQITFSAKDLKSENYNDVVKQFKDLGFTNVTTEQLKDIKKDSKLKFLSAEDGEVDKVSIDDNEKFKEGEVFSKDAKVVITYHTYSE